MNRHPVGPVDRFAPGAITIVQVGTREIGIVNSGGTLYAVLNVCPHALAPVCSGARISGTPLPCAPGEMEYGLEGRILRCPWHGYEFDLGDGGRAVLTRFRGKLRMYPVHVVDGEVQVELPAAAVAAADAVA